VTEIENSCLVNDDCAPSDTVTASEIMESMVNGCSKE
jgi:hypothetical protein